MKRLLLYLFFGLVSLGTGLAWSAILGKTILWAGVLIGWLVNCLMFELLMNLE